MFKVELEFDTNLPEETVNALCEQADEIFKEEGIPCSESSFGKRIYKDIHGADDYGYIWAALLEIRSIKDIASNVIKAFWSDKYCTENLTNGFF